MNIRVLERPRLFLVTSLGLLGLSTSITGCNPSSTGCEPAAASRSEPTPAFPLTSSDTAQPAAPQTPPSSAPVDGKKASFLDAGAKHGGKSLDQWIVQLGDKDELARSAAADAVANYGTNAKAAVPPLVKLLKNPDDLSFVPALMAIGKIGQSAGEAVGPLIALLKHPKGDVQKLAAGTLGELGPPAAKAVPALISALAAVKVDNEDERDQFRWSIQQLGKYDIRVVFAAVRAKRLNDVDIQFVIASLGHTDTQAVDGLVEELKRKDRDWAIYALAGLKRIGPKAASALPGIRPLLDDKSPEVRKSAAEAVAAIEAGDGKNTPQPGGPKGEERRQEGSPEDITDLMAKAGFKWNVFTLDRVLALYIRFGSMAQADKYTRGDRAAKAEMEGLIKECREAARKRPYRLSNMKLIPVTRQADIGGDGLVVSVVLPMRVRGEKPFKEGAAALTGILSNLHPSEADSRQYGFLTNEGTIRACTPADATAVQRNNGVLYHPEVRATTLYIGFKGPIEELRELAKHLDDYTIEIDFSDLRLDRPLAWGHFRQDAYRAARHDCQQLWADYLLDKDNVRPVYFPTAWLDKNPEKIPEVVQARLNALRVRNKAGEVVGGYLVK